MSIEKDYQNVKNVVEAYQQKLALISDEQWQLTPPTGGWSYSEVYFHIFDSSILTLDTLADAAQGNGKVVRTPFIPKLILFFGALPPGKKFTAPNKLADRVKKISRDKTSILINQFLSQLETEIPKLQRASKSVKTKHPRLGYFNAFQWLRFAYIHLNHHLKQLKRIEKSF
ncbi:DinB family protein [Pedobacter sp. PWIIR3]